MPNGWRYWRRGGQGTHFARILPQRAEGAKNALESPPSAARYVSPLSRMSSHSSSGVGCGDSLSPTSRGGAPVRQEFFGRAASLGAGRLGAVTILE